MIYQIRHTTKNEDGKDNVKTFEIDDTVFFAAQPIAFRKTFDKLKKGNIAEFDNAVAFINGQRVLVSEKGGDE